MKGVTAAVVLAALVLWPSAALTRDPFGGEDRPASPEPERDPDPAPLIAPPPGIYYVTETYVADVVTSSGPVTTYATTTVNESTGSYARVLDIVATGASSIFDGSAFNGRRALGDGRAVAGTYYENYVLDAGGFVPVSVVFFQDDAELARLRVPTPPPPNATATPSTPPATTRPVVPGCCAAERPVTGTPSRTSAPTKSIQPGLSLLPASAPLASLEVLRGRIVSLYPRAFVEGREVPVRSWTVIAGDAGEALATRGSGSVPFRTWWRRLAPPAAAYEVVFRIEVDTPDTGHRVVDVAIAVVVRSPALED
jgi:hypothetical protein